MKKIRKTYSGVVPNGKVLNSKNNSLQDTYSSDYLNRAIPNTNDLGEIIVDDVTCKNTFNAYSVNIVTRSNEETYTINGVNKITVSSLSSSSTWNRIKVTINGLKPNTKYTINSDVNNPSQYRAGLLCEYATNSINNIRTDANFNSKITVTTDSNGVVEIQFFINHSGTGHLTTVIFDNIQLEEGTVASKFVEHKEFDNAIVQANVDALASKLNVITKNTGGGMSVKFSGALTGRYIFMYMIILNGGFGIAGTFTMNNGAIVNHTKFLTNDASAGGVNITTDTTGFTLTLERNYGICTIISPNVALT